MRESMVRIASCGVLLLVSCASSSSSSSTGDRKVAAREAGVVQTEAMGVSGREVLMQAFAAIRSEALGRERVDWDALEKQLSSRLSKDAMAVEAMPLIMEAMAALNDPHVNFVPAAPLAVQVALSSGDSATTLPPPVTETTKAAMEPAHPPVPTMPEGRMLEGRFGYLLMPMRPHAADAELLAYAREIRSILAQLEQESPVGWIIDLRFNGGGSLWPMLLGLSPLLVDGSQLTSVNGSQVTAVFVLSGNRTWIEANGIRSDALTFADPEPYAPKVASAPVALLTGPWTLSSGEALTIALRSLANVRTFGEPTGGLTTVTQQYTLADGSVMTLPVAVMGDRHGRAVDGSLLPDHVVPFNNWPRDDDVVVTAAQQWILEQRR